MKFTTGSLLCFDEKVIFSNDGDDGDDDDLFSFKVYTSRVSSCGRAFTNFFAPFGVIWGQYESDNFRSFK